jgi:hypothetical protein
MTTFMNYGPITDKRQKEIIHDLAKPKKEIKADADEIAEKIYQRLSKDVYSISSTSIENS